MGRATEGREGLAFAPAAGPQHAPGTQPQQLVHYGVLTREARAGMLGLECPDRLEWRGWMPGTEYVKALVLKNVSTRALTVMYKQTSSKAFSMAFPEPIKLRPGMSHSLQVVFRPLKLQAYRDSIEIFINDTASCTLRVEALTPTAHVQMPATLSFGFVPCKQLHQQPLVVHNTGDVVVNTKWQLEPPFSIEPRTATLQPGSATQFVVSFRPEQAGSFTGHAACTVNGSATQVCAVSGVAKFPYLSLEHTSVDFGTVMVGKTLERLVRFGNHSLVAANFTISHDTPDTADGVFTIHPMTGTLGPEEFSVLRLVYTPKHATTFSCEGLTLSTPGGNRLGLTLKGSAGERQVKLSTRAFNFGNVPCGTTASRVLYLQNTGDVPALYDFQVDALDCFTISKPQGVIKPGLTAHVTITFKPVVPANFWRRVVCLIQDSQPAGLDLLATAYSDASRPPPLEHRHVQRYLARVAAGGSPVETDDPGGVAPTLSTVAALGQTGDTQLPPGTASSLVVQELAGPDAWTLQFEGQDPANAVTVDRTALSFGACSRLTAAEYQAVVVTNNTSAKLVAFMHVPTWQDPAGGEPKAVFQVFPESTDLKPGGQATFRIAFRPTRDAAHIRQILTVCAHVKSMRNFRLVSDAQVVPPWSIPITVCGNTFLHTNPEFSPKINVSHHAVAFPPCHPGQEVHQTIALVNYGDTPAGYTFTNVAALAPTVFIKPALGVVSPGSHALVALRFRPATTRPWRGAAVLMLNGVAVATTRIALSGAGYTPALVADLTGLPDAKGDPAAALPPDRAPAEQTMYFRPTCLGATATRTILLRNPSRVPVAWSWQLPSKLAGIVEVSPAAGLLLGRESVPLTWMFAPAQQKVYEARTHCLIEGSGRSRPTSAATSTAGLLDAAQGISLRVVGEGTAGALIIDPPTLDLGDIKVGHPVRRTVRLVNQSDGLLQYSLSCEALPPEGSEEDGGYGSDVDAPRVELFLAGAGAGEIPSEEMWVDEPNGVMAARAAKDVAVTLYPRYRRRYSLQLLCRSAAVVGVSTLASGTTGPGAPRLPPLLPGRDQGLPPAPDVAAEVSAKRLEAGGAGVVMTACPVAATATFPAVTVSDALLEGVPKQALWALQNLSEVNTELASGIMAAELALAKMEYKGTLDTDGACAMLRPFRLDFGIAQLGSPPSTLLLQLSNPGRLPAAWELQSYDAPDLELENWVEPGRPRNEAERARDFITQNHIFAMAPRSGVLQPGAACRLEFTYVPSHVGSHEFPMFLRIADGKRMHLQLAGRTAAPPVQRLLLPACHRTFTFPPTPIGALPAPLHAFPLRNGGLGPCAFSVDTAPLSTLTDASFGYEVIGLASPACGTIPPAGARLLSWRFSPLEARVYSVTLGVTLGDGSTDLLTLQGRGYHPRLPSAPAPLPAEWDREPAALVGYSRVPGGALAGARLVLPADDALCFGTALPGGVVRRLTLLTNTSRFPVTYDWRLGALGGDEDPDAADALQGGRLDVVPGSGRLEPGERVAVTFSLSAPLVPFVFEGDVQCVVGVDHAAVSAAAEAALEAQRTAEAAAAVELTDTGSVVEEVVVQHVEAAITGVGRARRLHASQPRVPVHLAMTAAQSVRFSKLSTELSQVWQHSTGSGAAGSALEAPTEPQIITLSLSGRTLTRAHIEAGACIPPQALQQARAQLTGSGWQPPVSQPFYVAAVDPATAVTEQGQQEQQLDTAADGAAGEGRSLEDEAALKGLSAELHAALGAASARSQPGDYNDPTAWAEDGVEDGRRGEPGDAMGGASGWAAGEKGGLKSRPGSPSKAPTDAVADSGADQAPEAAWVGEGPPIAAAAGLGPLEAVPEGPEEPAEATITPRARPVSEPISRPASPLAPDAVQAPGVPAQAPQDDGGSGVSLLPHVPAPALSHLPAPSAAEAARAAAATLLQQVLREALDPRSDPDLLEALQALPSQPLPAFVQLLAGGVPPLVTLGGTQVHAASTPEANTGAALLDKAFPPLSPLSHSQSAAPVRTLLAPGVELLKDPAIAQMAGLPEGGNAELTEVLADPAFQQFAEFVLERSVLSLLQESVAGDWQAAG